MANHHGSVATSLPSFSQAFSSRSLSNISPNDNALPPIQPRIPSHRLDQSFPRRPDPADDDSKPASRKRPAASRDDADDDNAPPSDLPHVKQEDGRHPHSPPPDNSRDPLDDNGPPDNPGTAPSPMKKRRVTVSGAPHPLNTDVRPAADQTNSTPISPVVIGFNINRDDPTALEHVRSSISVRQKQIALIDQRRGSLVPGPSNSSPPDERTTPSVPSKGPLPPRPSRRSPNQHTNPTARRVPQGSARPPSPSPMLIPSSQNQHQASSQTLPFPPISFARRRAGLLGGKKKPADILISPREAQSPDQLQPVIQSAPPIPHAAQGSFQSARLSMALPRLPPVMGATDNVRKVASNVPPTPTRLSLLRPPATAAAATTPMISVSGRSPPQPNVPIASALLPPTPASLQHPGYSGDKSAFLAPFEIFYDALNDSKHLKAWLGEQLQRSNALVQTLTQQQEKLNETIEAAVEKRVSGMRTEMISLRRRVDELEDALRNSSTGRRLSPDMASGLGKGKQPLRNGTHPAPPESYTFPPPSHEHPRHWVEPIRRGHSPSWMQERDVRGNPLPPPQHSGDSDRQVSPPHDSRRLTTVSATRLDPPRTREPEPSSHHYHSRPGGVNIPSPPQLYREHPPSSGQNLAPMRDTHSRSIRNERPGLTRQHSHSHAESGLPSGGRSPNPPPPAAPSQQQQKQQSLQSSSSSSPSSTSSGASSRKPASPRNTVAMSPPNGPPSGESS